MFLDPIPDFPRASALRVTYFSTYLETARPNPDAAPIEADNEVECNYELDEPLYHAGMGGLADRDVFESRQTMVELRITAVDGGEFPDRSVHNTKRVRRTPPSIDGDGLYDRFTKERNLGEVCCDHGGETFKGGR